MSIAILAVVSLSMMATVKKVKMHERALSTTGQIITYEVNEGLNAIQVPIAALQDGFYNVKLIVDGECVDSKKIY